MLLNLVLANLTILLLFYFYFVLFFTIPVEIQNEGLKIPGAPINVVNDAIEMLPFVTDKNINDLSK